MITFFSLGEQGRLGNQLFQYAALKSLGLNNNYEVKIPNPKTRQWHGQTCLLDNFNLEVDYFTQDDIDKLKYQYEEPDHMSFDDNFFSIQDDTNISGFFQTTYYFNKFENQIKKELTPKKEIIDNAERYISNIRQQNTDYEIVSLHLRRGDNTDWSNRSQLLNQNYGDTNELSENSFYYKYFKSAKDKFKNKKVKFLVFTGGARDSNSKNETDIEWCKRNFIGDEYLFSEGHDAMTDFSSIMLCDHNILSHISSFGWWAAYLNSSENKIVVAPKHYHPDMPEFTHRKGYFPKNFTVL